MLLGLYGYQEMNGEGLASVPALDKLQINRDMALAIDRLSARFGSSQ
jgi:hypothetical protein